MFQGQHVFQGQQSVETRWSLNVPHMLVVISLSSASAERSTAADKAHLVMTMWPQYSRALLSALHDTPGRELVCDQLPSSIQFDEHSLKLTCNAFLAENKTLLQAFSQASD